MWTSGHGFDVCVSDCFSSNPTEREREPREPESDEDEKRSPRFRSILELREKASCILQHVLIDYEQHPLGSSSIQKAASQTSMSGGVSSDPEKEEGERKTTEDEEKSSRQRAEDSSALRDSSGNVKERRNSEVFVWKPFLRMSPDLIQFDRTSVKLTLVFGNLLLHSSPFFSSSSHFP